MATLTRLASTLTAKYFPSQTLTDAFYIDGRLFGKRETRQADITIDKEERGFFFSVFAHPRIPEYEPGMMPPYEPELRHTINEVKFGRKEIDGMIEGFLTTAVDVTGKMKLADSDSRSPYFAGVIVRDAEAFAVTIGSGLAFLYRDDTLFPLTDAGIPMEPIDANGDRVGDFLYYCSSKTANALWSNFFTLSPDDCIILCNKEIYDALGQREILRILNDAEDQCDAAGVIITQASARMPGVPMQFSISFVESVTSDEKRGLFGFRKKNKEEDTSDMSVKSTVEGGVVGAAASAAADAGFTGGLAMTDAEDITGGASLVFGDNGKGPAAPSFNQPASADKGFEVSSADADKAVDISFPETTAPVEEISAEDMMKSLFGAGAGAATAGTAAGAETSAAAAAEAGSPFVATFNPFDEPAPAPAEVEMKTVSETAFEMPVDSDDEATKPVERIDADFIESLHNDDSVRKDGIIEAAIREMSGAAEEGKTERFEEKVEPVIGETFVMPEPEPEMKEVTPEPEIPSMSDSGELVFTEASVSTEFGGMETPSAEEAFDPYSVGSSEEMQNTAPLVFGDDGTAPAPDFAAPEADGSDIPEFKFTAEKPVLTENDKLAVDFPVEDAKVVNDSAAEAEEVTPDGEFKLPFANDVETIPEEKPVAPEQSDIPDMPLYSSNSYDTPVAAVSSEQPVNSNPQDVYTYGQYRENENMADDSSYQSFGSEGSNYSDFTGGGSDGYGYHNADAGYGAPMTPDGEIPVSYGDTTMFGQEAPAAPDAGAYSEPVYDPSVGAEEGYSEFVAPETPAGDGYVSSYEDNSTSDSGDDWINGILGLDGMDSAYQSGAAADPAGTSAAYAGAAAGTAARAAATRPGGPGRPVPGRRPASAGASRGKKRKIPKLNRNGYIFLAFVLIMLICFIILIAVIAKACSKDEEPAETEATTTPVEIIDTEPTETEPPIEQPADDLAPIGVFYFSDNIGYKSWWDLFNKVYDIQLLNESDAYVQKLIDYNNYYCATQGLTTTIPAGYKPAAGDQFILPAPAVLADTFVIPDASGNGTTTQSGVSGQVDVVNGTDASTPDANAAETSADANAAAPENGDAAGGQQGEAPAA